MVRYGFYIALVCNLTICVAPSAADTPRLPSFNSPIVPWTEVITPVVRGLLPDLSIVASTEKLDTLLLSDNSSFKFINGKLVSRDQLADDDVELAVITDSRPSAFALPAIEAPLHSSPARVCISTGLLEMLQSESELAFVIAHEFSHLNHDHFSPDLPFAMFTPKQLAQIAAVHQNWEYRADADAINLLSSQGFVPSDSVQLLRRLEQFEEGNTSSHRNHPLVSERIARLTQALPN